jgi:hypothetical protein
MSAYRMLTGWDAGEAVPRQRDEVCLSLKRKAPDEGQCGTAWHTVKISSA